MDNTPVSLLRRLKECGDEQLRERSWERFVSLFTPLLYCWATRLGAQDADAADLVQDTFLVLHRKLPEFNYDPSRSFRAWLRTILTNRWREKQRRPQAMAGHAALLDQLPSPDAAAELTEAEYQQHLVHRAMQLLQSEFPEATWRAFWETAVLGRPALEVARGCGLAVEAVYQINRRVRRRLRQELEGLMD